MIAKHPGMPGGDPPPTAGAGGKVSKRLTGLHELRLPVVGYRKDGRPIHPIRGASDDDQQADKPADKPAEPAPPADKPATFTQDQVNAVAAREKAAGRRAAEEKIANDLGVSIVEAKQIIADAKKAADAEKSDATKAREAADREKDEAAKAVKAAKDEVHETRVQRALVAEGITDDKKLAHISRMVGAQPGATYEEVQAAVAVLRKDMPELFQTVRAPNGDPTGKAPANGQTHTTDPGAAGRERAKQMISKQRRGPLTIEGFRPTF